MVLARVAADKLGNRMMLMVVLGKGEWRELIVCLV